MTVVNLREAQQILGFKTPFTLRKAIKDGHLGAYLRSGPDRRCIYLELTPAGLPPWSELQWVTLRNVIELAEDS